MWPETLEKWRRMMRKQLTCLMNVLSMTHPNHLNQRNPRHHLSNQKMMIYVPHVKTREGQQLLHALPVTEAHNENCAIPWRLGFLLAAFVHDI